MLQAFAHSIRRCRPCRPAYASASCIRIYPKSTGHRGYCAGPLRSRHLQECHGKCKASKLQSALSNHLACTVLLQTSVRSFACKLPTVHRSVCTKQAIAALTIEQGARNQAIMTHVVCNHVTGATMRNFLAGRVKLLLCFVIPGGWLIA